MAKTAIYTETVALITVAEASKIFWNSTMEGKYTAPQRGPKNPAAVTTPKMKYFLDGRNAEYGGGEGLIGIFSGSTVWMAIFFSTLLAFIINVKRNLVEDFRLRLRITHTSCIRF